MHLLSPVKRAMLDGPHNSPNPNAIESTAVLCRGSYAGGIFNIKEHIIEISKSGSNFCKTINLLKVRKHHQA